MRIWLLFDEAVSLLANYIPDFKDCPQASRFLRERFARRIYMVTNIFPDGKISRPQLGIFAFRLRQKQKYTCAFKILKIVPIFLRILTLWGFEPQFQG